MIHDAQIYLTPRSYTRPFRLWYRFSLPLLGRRGAAILTVSDYSRDQLVRFGVAPRDRITVIHNGADHILRAVPDRAIVERLALAPRRYACALANTQAHKNIAMLLRAFADRRLGRPEARADRVRRSRGFRGARPCRPAQRRLRRPRLRRGIARSARGCALFPLPVDHGRLWSAAAGKHAARYPGHRRARGGAARGMWRGRALRGRRRPRSDWARRLRQLADDPAVWRMWSDLGRERAATFTWRKAALRLIAVIDGLADERPSRGPSSIMTTAPEKNLRGLGGDRQQRQAGRARRNQRTPGVADPRAAPGGLLGRDRQ